MGRSLERRRLCRTTDAKEDLVARLASSPSQSAAAFGLGWRRPLIAPLSGFFGIFLFDEKGRLTFLFPISMRMN